MADAAHPSDWPYPEKVMGWAGHPIIRCPTTARRPVSAGLSSRVVEPPRHDRST